MARRDLSRTVIEGGRTYRSSFERRASHGAARTHERTWLDDVGRDDDFEESRALRGRPGVHKQFYDKLAVTRRWLRSQCGRPWDDVFSDLMARFDPRTVAGRHVVFDHMLHDVRGAIGDEPWRSYRFAIDADGILRRHAAWHEARYLHRRGKRVLPPWTGGFQAARHEGRWWWVGDRLVGPCAQRGKCRYAHAHLRDGTVHHFTRATLIRPMTSTDVGRLGSSTPRVRALVLWRGPFVDPADAELARPPSAPPPR
jgi:hypothetical protein